MTAVFQGDMHYYDYYENEGLPYFITGGAGSPLYDQLYNPDWGKNEVLVVDVSPTEVKVEAVLPDGKSLDQRTIKVKP